MQMFKKCFEAHVFFDIFLPNITNCLVIGFFSLAVWIVYIMLKGFSLLSPRAHFE